MNESVSHDPNQHRFTIEIDGHTGLIDYIDQGAVWALTHTYVPVELRGQGVAAKLVEAAFDAARKAGVKIDPQCSYVATYMQRHSETADLRV
ncbi:MAG: GNAT family N-acetyltransferase [Synoicihabitans sp.]